MQCFRIFPVAKKFLDKWGGGDIKTFRRNFFLSHCRKISYGNHFEQCFRNFPVAKKFMDKGRGRCIKIFRRKNFLHSAEFFVGLTFDAVFQKFSGSEKVYG